MAAIAKLFMRRGFTTLRPLNQSKLRPTHFNRLISTSKDNKDSLAIPEENPEYLQEVKKFEDISDPDENWVSQGFSYIDREWDTIQYNVIFFWMYTVCFIGSMFIVAYYPDFKMTHWRQREAYLELARREKLGLPLIDPNLIPADKLEQYMPSDEELGDTEIII